jgi:4-amino-4-deoxy-L-arabinose transferase-like glycosyltransferase
VEHLKRGAVAALNWFGITLFGTLGFLIWLGWIAMITGYPAKIKERLSFLSGTSDIQFSFLLFSIALVVSIIWLSTCIRSKYTNKSAVTNWAVGMTLSWSLLMTLWLPLIDSAKSYQSVFISLNEKVPAQYNCMNSLNVGQAQRLLLNYYTDIELHDVETTKNLNCDLYLIQDLKGVGKMQPSQEWTLIWRGKRPADRKESFRLYQTRH